MTKQSSWEETRRKQLMSVTRKSMLITRAARLNGEDPGSMTRWTKRMLVDEIVALEAQRKEASE